jgi:RHS repeat-associated protein
MLGDPTGQVLSTISYDSFGSVVNETGVEALDRFQYTARELNKLSASYHFRARSFQSRIGRFTSPDPIASRGADYNVYRYVANSPTHARDPRGTFIGKIITKILEMIKKFFELGHHWEDAWKEAEERAEYLAKLMENKDDGRPLKVGHYGESAPKLVEELVDIAVDEYKQP